MTQLNRRLGPAADDKLIIRKAGGTFAMGVAAMFIALLRVISLSAVRVDTGRDHMIQAIHGNPIALSAICPWLDCVQSSG